jgi:putative radical SAM enzyme (TIGR03279 family)
VTARRRPQGVTVAAATGPAARGGLREGDCIVRLNGAPPRDVLDLELGAADGTLWLTVLRDGHPLDLVIVLPAGEWHGVSLAGGLGDRMRTCRNRCRFCFVDQLPAGLRPSLYVKDDDYRHSFLHGSFVTLTNLSEADVERLVELRLSPLYVSLHAWDDEARAALMGSPARASRAILERLAGAGLELHLQIVLCPGWNDGAVLTETVDRTAAIGCEDVGVVPVSLAAEGDLRRVTSEDASRLLTEVAAWQEAFVASLGRSYVHAADEFYLLVGLLPPFGDAPLQYENGIGMSAQLLLEARELAAQEAGRRAAAAPPGQREPTSLRVLTGALGVPVIQALAGTLTAARVRSRPFAVTNALFGPHVTVTGLLGGEEVVEALRREPLADGEWLLAPRTFLPGDLGRTLDDVSEETLAAACRGRLVVAGDLHEAFARLPG